MLVVRYVALAALVVWLGALFDDLAGRSDAVPYVCAALIITCLLVMKFVGPPPHGFIPRVSLVVAMVIVTVGSASAFGRRQAAPAAIDFALGLVLLFWYVRES